MSEDEEAIVGDEGESEAARGGGGSGWGKLALGIVIGAAGAFGLLAFLNRRPRDDKSDLLRR